MTYSYRLERRLVSTASFLVLALIAVYALTPIVWTVITSLKLPRDILTVPPSLTFTPTLDNYQEALFKGGFARALLNSVIIGAGATLLSLAAGSLAAYALARFRFRGSNVLAYAILMTRMFPPVIAGLPLFILFQNLGLVDTHLGLILAHTTFSLPFVVWMMRSFFFTIPPSLEEAAMVDGCSQLGALVRVTLPLAAPGLAATSIFALIGSWNDLFFALILSRTNTPTLPVTAASFVTEQGVLWGQINAASVIIMAPIVVFTILMQKHLTRGLIAGGVKG